MDAGVVDRFYGTATTAAATKTLLENKHLGNVDYIVCDYCYFLASFFS